MIKRLKVPIYGRPLVFVDTRYEATLEFNRLQKGGHETEADWDCYGCTDECKGTIVMFVDGRRDHPGGEIATVVHEAVHAAGKVLGYAGVEYGPDNDEQLAYLVGWIVTQWNRRIGNAKEAENKQRSEEGGSSL